VRTTLGQVLPRQGNNFITKDHQGVFDTSSESSLIRGSIAFQLETPGRKSPCRQGWLRGSHNLRESFLGYGPRPIPSSSSFWALDFPRSGFDTGWISVPRVQVKSRFESGLNLPTFLPQLDFSFPPSIFFVPIFRVSAEGEGHFEELKLVSWECLHSPGKFGPFSEKGGVEGGV